MPSKTSTTNFRLYQHNLKEMPMTPSRSLVFVMLVLVVLVIVFPLIATGQTFRGSINGTVTDASGAVIPGARITATDVATQVVRNTVSSGAGEFSFNDLPQSTYTVKVEASAFQATETTGVQVQAGKIYTLPVKLNVRSEEHTSELQ